MRLAIVDIETTGLRFSTDRIIEVGVIVVENYKVINTYSTLINPGESIPARITEITGIATHDVKGAPTFADIAQSLLEILADCIFVAHNAAFDYGFMQAEFARLNQQFHPSALCTVRLSRKLFPQFHRHSLAHIIERFQINTTDRHRALADAQAVWDFLQLLPTHFDQAYIDLAMQQIINTHKTPVHIEPYFVQGLPECAGVYIFYDKDKTPLYVGKSINIKERVKQHFQQSTKETKEFNINQNLADIKIIPTAGELGALLLESKLVKELYPLYNHQLRRTKKLFALKKSLNTAGYFVITGNYIENIALDELEDIMGIFTSQKQAENYLRAISQEHTLCHKLLNLQKVSGACFQYHLKKCNGACLIKESTTDYNTRLLQSFARTRLQSWPYQESITITETSKDGKITDTFCVNQWCVIEQRSNEIVNTYDLQFNLDHYKIIRRFIPSTSPLSQKEDVPVLY